VAAALEKLSYNVEWLNADLAQSDREKVMEQTREGKLRFLVCTDVASRGIDISSLTHVINFDFPESPEAYVHRTGRTGRAGRTGTAISLITPADIGFLYFLRLTYKIVPIERHLPSATELRTREQLDLVDMFVEAFGNRIPHQDDVMLARRLMSHESAEIVLAGLLRDHLGARPETAATAAESRRSRTPCEQINCSSAPETRSKTLEAKPKTLEAKPKTLEAKPKTLEAKPKTLEAKPKTLEAKPKTLEAKPNSSLSTTLASTQPGSDQIRKTVRSGSPEDAEQRNRRRPRRSDQDLLESDVHQSTSAPVEEEFDFKYTVQDGGAASGAKRPEGLELSTQQHLIGPQAIAEVDAEIFVSLGRRDGVSSEDVIAALQSSSIDRSAVNHVSVRHHHTFVGVVRTSFDAALLALDGANIAGRLARAEPAKSSRP
jgi:superfamily II DNA/RNA helicase